MMLMVEIGLSLGGVLMGGASFFITAATLMHGEMPAVFTLCLPAACLGFVAAAPDAISEAVDDAAWATALARSVILLVVLALMTALVWPVMSHANLPMQAELPSAGLPIVLASTAWCVALLRRRRRLPAASGASLTSESAPVPTAAPSQPSTKLASKTLRRRLSASSRSTVQSAAPKRRPKRGRPIETSNDGDGADKSKVFDADHVGLSPAISDGRETVSLIRSRVFDADHVGLSPPLFDGRRRVSLIRSRVFDADHVGLSPPLSDGRNRVSLIRSRVFDAGHVGLSPPLSDDRNRVSLIRSRVLDADHVGLSPPLSEGRNRVSPIRSRVFDAGHVGLSPPLSDGRKRVSLIRFVAVIVFVCILTLAGQLPFVAKPTNQPSDFLTEKHRRTGRRPTRRRGPTIAWRVNDTLLK